MKPPGKQEPPELVVQKPDLPAVDPDSASGPIRSKAQAEREARRAEPGLLPPSVKRLFLVLGAGTALLFAAKWFGVSHADDLLDYFREAAGRLAAFFVPK